MVQAASKKQKDVRAVVGRDSDAVVYELLHRTACCNNALGFAPSSTNWYMNCFTPGTIRTVMLDRFAHECMTLVSVHVTPSRASGPYAPSQTMQKCEAAKAHYTGGDLPMNGASPHCRFAVTLQSVP